MISFDHRFDLKGNILLEKPQARFSDSKAGQRRRVIILLSPI